MTQLCDHRHADVSQHACGLCWLSGEADPDFYGIRYVGADDVPDVQRKMGLTWDTCREKHIKEARAA